MTDFQREILKTRELVSFHYEKSDVKIEGIEEELNGQIHHTLLINLYFDYYFDTSLINVEEIKEDLIENNIIKEKTFNWEITKEDFSFKHNIVFKINLDELKKNTYLKEFNLEQIEEYLKAKIYSKEFKEIVFNIGLVEAISYYKIFPVQNFIITGELNEYQKDWWTNLFFNGLGEYRYLNSLLSIDEDKFIKIISNPKIDEYYEYNSDENINLDLDLDLNLNNDKYLNIEKQGFLIPIGGGKDSVVTLELLKDFKNQNTLFAIDLKGTRKETAFVAGFNLSEIVDVKRNFDDKLKERNKQGFFNGHIPFSAVVAFLSLLSAYILNKKYIVLSNELSANETSVKDLMINHQYSKSIDFETNFREYIEFLNIDIEYFSILRPLTVVGIIKLFVKYEKYFKVFNSCNVGSKGDKWNWCGNCAKCLFTFIILAPFLYKDKLVEIFGTDVFENEELLEDMYKLIGKRDVKPFECVGTIAEVRFSLNELMKKLNIGEKKDVSKKEKLPILLEKYKEIYLLETRRSKSKLEEKEAESLENLDENKNLYLVYNQDNYLPDFLEEIVKKAIQGE